MWRIGLIIALLLLVTGGSVWAQIERNPYSRAGSGEEEELLPELELPVAPAEGDPAAISTMMRVLLAQRLVAAVSQNADYVLGVPAAQSPADTGAPLDAMSIALSTEPEVEAEAARPAITAAAEPEPVAPPEVEPPAAESEPEPAPELPVEEVKPEPAASSLPEPEATPVADTDPNEPVVLTEELLNADEPAAPVVEEEPVEEPVGAPVDAIATLDDLAAALSERRQGDPPAEARPTAGEEEPTERETPELLHNYSYGLDRPEPDAADEAAAAQPEPDSRRPQLMKPRRGAEDSETEAEQAPEPTDAQPAATDDAGGPDAAATNTGEAEASAVAQSNAVRTAPAGRAKPEEAPRSWRRPRFELPSDRTEPLPDEDEGQAPADETVPPPAVTELPEFSLDTPPTMQLGTAALMADGLMLAPSGIADQPPVDPVLNTAKAGMPNYDVSSRITSVSRGNSRKKQVALTFDDGPHPEFTSQLLAVLEYYDVPATFFYVGVQAQKYPHWVKMTHQAGHEIASQTYDHFRLPKLPREEKIYQIDEYQRLIEGLIGVTPRFLRPPGGQVDPETEELVAERGMVLGLWDVGLNDTRDGKTKQQMLDMAKRKIRSGSVVLAHDGIQATVDMLPELIEYLRGQGYEFVTMSELAAGM
ncbi:polysaccharide deacetylase family protein [bacterium]|nr:polysaccharide deacetylase family protein [bacterium]